MRLASHLGRKSPLPQGWSLVLGVSLELGAWCLELIFRRAWISELDAYRVALATVPLPDGVRTDSGIRVDKLLARVGLADSVTDAARKIKAGAVQFNGEKVKEIMLSNPPAELLIQVGKNWKRVA